MRSLALLLVVVLALLSGCATPPPSKAIDCGPPTGLVPHPASPELTGVPLGPLLIRGAFPAGATSAKLLGFEHGRPTKMLVLVGRDMETDIALTGMRCSDGQPVRFWLNKGGGGIWTFGPTSSPVPDEVMAATGDLRAVLPKLSALPGASQGYGGYILFPTADTYRIEAFADTRKIGDGVLVVSSEPYPAGRPSPSPDPRPAAAAGEREFLAKLEGAGFPVETVLSTPSQALLRPETDARLIQLADGTRFDVLFFADDAAAAALRVCEEPNVPGRYRYRLITPSRSVGIDSAANEVFLRSGNAVVMLRDLAALAPALRTALGATSPAC